MPALSYTAAPETREAPADRRAPGDGSARSCVYTDLESIEYGAAWNLQRELSDRRKLGLIEDSLLFAEHPAVITMGRSARREHILISREQLDRLGVALWETNRGGDVTYHGPGQLIGYAIVDLREWKRDVVAYLRALEQVLIDTAAEFGIAAERMPGCTGVWVQGAKLAALGVHVSRWVTSHGFALNVTTNLHYFGYIVPCGIAKPVTSIEQLLGEAPPRSAVVETVARHFGHIFGRRMKRAERNDLWAVKPQSARDKKP
jgi:lipoyl(octanoyl) transferase